MSKTDSQHSTNKSCLAEEKSPYLRILFHICCIFCGNELFFALIENGSSYAYGLWSDNSKAIFYNDNCTVICTNHEIFANKEKMKLSLDKNSECA
jgi:hypothetical protein